ncbi:MAG: PKD domain-containing protein [Bacteroidetes bacterium]|nr:PKD domain-containing protein [Bacteroidota bacterium]
MFKRKIIFIIIVCVCHISIKAQICPSIISFTCGVSLPNPCITYKTITRIYGGTPQTFTVSLNYGDGSPLFINSYNAGSGSVWPVSYHTYTANGTYTLTEIVTGPGTCSSSATSTVLVTGNCESCPTYSNISTGFNRTTNSYFTSSNDGNFDPYWYVTKKQLLAYSTFTPIPSTETYYTNMLAYDIDPNGSWYGQASGNSRFISLNSTSSSQDPAPYITTYRTYFKLPSVLPYNKSYKLLMSLRADDGIYQVGLNGTDIKSPGYGPTGAMYSGDPMILSVNSCSSSILKADSNYIDIRVSDTYLAATQLNAEILLYECTNLCNTSSTVCPNISSFTYINLPNNTGCQKFEFNAGINGYYGSPCPTSSLVASINFGDGSPTYTSCADGGGFASSHQFTSAGTYTVNLTVTGPGTCVATAKSIVTVTCNPPPCTDCISSFAPVPEKKYLVSAWVKEKNAPQSKTSYTFPSLTILFPSISSSTSPFLASGAIIDGWQRVEGEFTIPSAATNMSIKLDCNTGDCFFDDVRVLPFDGSMKSYVYDPVTMRLVAELDERNYATLYEYDEEGKLIRVKKETEKGKMTIQENRNNTKK